MMSIIKVYSKFGEVEVEPLTLVDIHPSANAEEKSIINSDSNREHQE